MGLGKTLQSISLLTYNYEYKNIKGPSLVITPKSTLVNWQREFGKFSPKFRIFLLDGNKDERADMIKDYITDYISNKGNNGNDIEFDICITSYEQFNIERNHLKKINWFYIIVDEAHRMKNENAKLSKSCRMMTSEYRLLITGTPLQNDLHELWSLLNFLLPKAFNNSVCFDDIYELSMQNELKDKNIIDNIHKLIRPIMLRRLKIDVEKNLLPKIEIILNVGLSTLQLKLYKSLIAKDITTITDITKGKKSLLNTAMQLRKCCNHPYLFDGVEDITQGNGPHLWLNAGKMVLLDKLLPKLFQQSSRCLIFCQMTRMMDIIDDYLYVKGYKRCRIDGSTNGFDRQNEMDRFNDPNNFDDVKVFLLSTRAGGLGINLVTADVVIFYDNDWNPQMYVFMYYIYLYIYCVSIFMFLYLCFYIDIYLGIYKHRIVHIELDRKNKLEYSD